MNKFNKILITNILLKSCLKQFSRTVFWDSTALRLSYNCITVDALLELGIILLLGTLELFVLILPVVKEDKDARLHS